MKNIMIFSICLFYSISCQYNLSLEQVFSDFNLLKSNEECIMRTRSDYYGTNIYEYWIGNKRTAVKKRRGKYYYINSSDINRPMTDSILNVINYRIKKFTKYGVLEMCPTYSHSIVFSSDSKVLPNYIKKMARNINYEVIFKEDFKNENYTGYIKFDNDWFFKIDSIK